MNHLRAISLIWFLFGILGACYSLFDLCRNEAKGAFAGAIESDLIVLAFCGVAIFAGYGLLRGWRWARVMCAVAGVMLLLYALSYLLMVGLEFGVILLQIPSDMRLAPASPAAKIPASYL
jgi:hypothetical protein